MDRHRNLVEPPGVHLHRVAGFGDRVRWNLGPPRIRYEDAVLDLAVDARTDLGALGVRATACDTRRTTPARLLDSVGARLRVARRDWLASVLRDIADGTCSVLEHGYLVHVERPHGLPRGERQQPGASARGAVFRDVVYEEFALVVELDGRASHASVADRDRDLDRDLDAAVARLETQRIGYGQVFERACATAQRVAKVLNRRGWTGSATPCELCAASARAG